MENITQHLQGKQNTVADVRVKIDTRPLGLESGADDLPEDQPDIWPSGSGPVRIQANLPVPSLLQLAARSLCRSNRHPPSGLGIAEGFCQPTMESNLQGTSKDSNPESQHRAGHTSVKNTPMLSPTLLVEVACLFPRQATTETQFTHQFAVWSI